MVRLILTHPGGAHKDDALAACVLAATHQVPIVRRNPTPEELADPLVAIVDIGGSDDAALQNFDHHQYPADHPPTCALSLVLMRLGLYEDALQFCEWLPTAEWFDSRGPNRTADWLGVPRKVIAKLHSPIDITLMRRFSAASELRPGETLYEFMKMIGEDLIDYLTSIRTQIEEVAGKVEHWTLSSADEPFQAVFLPRVEPIPAEPSGALMAYIRDRKLSATTAAIVYPDRRGSGYGLTRYDDHPQLDFRQVSAEPDVRFAHASGFVCKTEAQKPARLQELLIQAWIPQQT
ncbi:MAG: MYG1 family protein [Myxococcota bacterium]